MARREAEVILVAGSRIGNLDIPCDEYWGDLAQHRRDTPQIARSRPVARRGVQRMANELARAERRKGR